MEYPTYLIHYGIPGQKWGTRRWQYEDGSLTPEGYVHYGYGKSASKTQAENYTKFRNRKLSGNSTAEDFINSVGTMAVSDYDNRFAQLGHTVYGEFKNVPHTGFSTQTTWGDGAGFLAGKTTVSQSTAFTMKKENQMNLDDESSIKHMLGQCNSDYGSTGTTQNCTKVSATTALYKMGYTGIQAGTLNFPASADAMSYWFDGAHRVEGDATSCEDQIKKQGAGAFGSFSIRYPEGGGHALSYSVLSDGRVRIEEGQDNSCFTGSISDVMKRYGADPSHCSYTRLDNTKPNLKNMAEDGVVVDAGNRIGTTYNVRSGIAGEQGFNGSSFTREQYAQKILGNPKYTNNKLDGIKYNFAGGYNESGDNSNAFTTLLKRTGKTVLGAW